MHQNQEVNAQRQSKNRYWPLEPEASDGQPVPLSLRKEQVQQLLAQPNKATQPAIPAFQRTKSKLEMLLKNCLLQLQRLITTKLNELTIKTKSKPQSQSVQDASVSFNSSSC